MNISHNDENCLTKPLPKMVDFLLLWGTCVIFCLMLLLIAFMIQNLRKKWVPKISVQISLYVFFFCTWMIYLSIRLSFTKCKWNKFLKMSWSFFSKRKLWIQLVSFQYHLLPSCCWDTFIRIMVRELHLNVQFKRNSFKNIF